MPYPSPRFQTVTLDDGEISGGGSSAIRDWGPISAGTFEIDPAAYRVNEFILNQMETTLTIAPITRPARLLSVLLFATQDDVGTRTMLWPSNFRWQGGFSPALSVAPGSTDMIQLLSKDSGATWFATLSYQSGPLMVHPEGFE